MGIKFFTNQPPTNFGGGVRNILIDNKSKLVIDSVIEDTSSWVKFKGNFIADSAYNFIVIGNFFISDSLTIHSSDPMGCDYSYIYLDNFCLSTDSNECFVEPISSEQEQHIYYSSNYLHFDNFQENNFIKIYTVLGQFVLSQFIYGKEVPVSVSTGIYFIEVNQKIFKVLIF